MTKHFVDYSGHILFVLYFSLIAGSSLIGYLRNSNGNRASQIHRLKLLLRRLRLAGIVCTVSFLALSFDAVFNAKMYLWQDAVWMTISLFVCAFIDIYYQTRFWQEHIRVSYER